MSYQEILFFNQGPVGHWKWLLALGVGSCSVPRRYWLFDRLRDSFAEAV